MGPASGHPSPNERQEGPQQIRPVGLNPQSKVAVTEVVSLPRGLHLRIHTAPNDTAADLIT